MIPAPFWRGLHPDLWLWVPFTDGTARDISSYNRTPNITITGGAATIIPNYLHIDINSSSPTNFTTSLAYNLSPYPVTRIPQAIPMTMEGFVKWVQSPNTTGPYDIFHFDPAPSSGGSERYHGYGNAGKVDYGDAGGPIGPTASNVLAPSGTLYHWAWVIPANPGTTTYFYINGIAVLSKTTGPRGDIILAPNARWQIGGVTNTNGGPPSHTEAYIGESRVVARNLYPGGATFTPPTPGNLSPII